MAGKLIPKGFYKVAESEFRNGIACGYYNKKRRALLFTVDDSVIGPIDADSLEYLLHVMIDMKEMKGKYFPLGD